MISILLACGLAGIAASGGYLWSWRRANRGYRQISALLLGIKDGDYTLRAIATGGARGGAFAAINALSDSLMGARRAGIESDALLGKLLGAVELAIIVIGPSGTIMGGNDAAGSLLGVPADRLMGQRPASLGIESWLDIDGPNRFDTALPGGPGPWDVRRVQFRRGGRDHLVLVASDLSRALRDEERRVWRGLIRVLSHETGNSLGPIQATAEALQRSSHEPDQIRDGLALIERRTRSLASFIRRYAELARLPPPMPETVLLGPLLQRIADLETRVPVTVAITDEAPTRLDPAQIEQALINLIRNAADAALETGGAVEIRLDCSAPEIRITIIDDGKGLPHTENLFIPGFTTKPGGSGIGLVLAREIIEAHQGTLHLTNRDDQPGAQVVVMLRY
jgi:nitrogen fixation/metabolism regulation signal transduction histidine kinase